MELVNKGRHRPLVEWICAALSSILVLGLVAFLGHDAIFGGTRPADIVVSIDEVERLDSGTMVMVTVANRGDKAAASVTVNASLAETTAPDKQIEFDYIAAHAVRRGAFLFPHAVKPEALDIQVGGYTEL